MIVIGTDPHKLTHTFAAVERQTGELQGSETVQASAAGHDRILAWGRALDAERIWAIEDCRHVSGRLERFLVARGERVVRVAPKLNGGRSPQLARARQVRPDRRAGRARGAA
jgi:transposase